MKKSTKIVLAIGAVGLLVAGYQDVKNRETNGLRRAHLTAWPDRTASCEHMKDNGETWALCRFWRTAPSAWLKRGDAWAAADGNAQMVISRLESMDTTGRELPRLYVDRQTPVYMTKPVMARFESVKAEIRDSRR